VETPAFTGVGPGIWALATGGLILVDLWYRLITAYYRPRELLAMVGRRVRRVFGDSS
jgi:hypothetical protein